MYDQTPKIAPPKSESKRIDHKVTTVSLEHGHVVEAIEQYVRRLFDINDSVATYKIEFDSTAVPAMPPALSATHFGRPQVFQTSRLIVTVTEDLGQLPTVAPEHMDGVVA